MALSWDKLVQRWQAAGVLDAAAAERIRAFESGRKDKLGHGRPVALALGLGGLMMAAGVLLFVAAHWDRISAGQRFSIVLTFVAAFHLLASLVSKHFPVLATVFHAVGTACLGAGIFLAAQIFNLEEDWATGILLWAIGAAIGWWLRKDWIQAAFIAVLVPTWLAGEWRLQTWGFSASWLISAEGLFLLALAYLTAGRSDEDSPIRRVLTWLGWLALIPCAVFVFVGAWEFLPKILEIPAHLLLLGGTAFLAAPLVLSGLLRGWRIRAIWLNLAAIPWVFLLGTMRYDYANRNAPFLSFLWNEIGPYVWCALAAVGLIFSGIQDKRKERINLGLLAFGITVVAFYFSTVMSKFGRSISLIGLGLLFVLLGTLLEAARRRLVGHLK